MQRRVEHVGGAELYTGRTEVAERMRRMRAIQQEALSILSMYPRAAPGLPAAGSGAPAAPPPPFSDEELVAATTGAPGAAKQVADAAGLGPAIPAAVMAGTQQPPQQQNEASPSGALPAGVSYYYNGKPVVQATFVDVWDAGTAVPHGRSQQEVADAIRLGRDLAGTDLTNTSPSPLQRPAAPKANVTYLSKLS